MNADERRLLAACRQLEAGQRDTLIAFAQFLAARVQAAAVPAVMAEPVAIPRPENESVVKAIRRLMATYPMLDSKHLLNETSGLMSQHMLQGRAAGEVIDDLELLFVRHYERQRAG